MEAATLIRPEPAPALRVRPASHQPRREPPKRAAMALVLVLAQSLVSVIHDDAVLSRPDTRNVTRSWRVAHIPAGARVVIEPQVSDDWATDVGTTPFSRGARAVALNFDWSIDYYPQPYRRPGPEMSIYRLSRGVCGTYVSSG